jgi:hypothetical protein
LKKLLFILIVSGFITKAQPGFVWANKVSGFSSEGHSIKLDSRGNVYTIGYFSDTADFDPGISTFNLISKGYQDIYVQKLTPLGNLLWAKSVGGKAWDVGYNIVLDSSDNIIISGSFADTVDFDPGPGIFNLISKGAIDVFVCKLDWNGNFIWAKQMGGMSKNLCFAMSLDGKGNIYTSGYFVGTSDFDPGPATYNLNCSGIWCDIFISKLDNAGNFVWAKQIGGPYNQITRGITCDLNGNVIATGVFCSTADFDPGPGTYNLTSQSFGGNIFVCMLDSTGNFKWAKKMGGSQWNEAQAIAVDSQNNIYTTGHFMDTCDFDPGSGIYNLISSSYLQGDIFVSKLTSSGNFIWAKSIGSPYWDIGYSIVVNIPGKVCITGALGKGNSDFDPGPSVYNLNSLNGGTFISILDTSGNFVCAGNTGGNKDCLAYSLASNSVGEIYSTGFFNGNSDFDPGAGTYYLTTNPYGFREAFVTKFNGCSTLLSENELTNDLEFLIFPNPSSGRFTFNLSGNFNQNQIMLYNLFGEKIKFEMSSENEIDLNDHPKGIYFVEVISDNERVTEKILLE